MNKVFFSIYSLFSKPRYVFPPRVYLAPALPLLRHSADDIVPDVGHTPEERAFVPYFFLALPEMSRGPIRRESNDRSLCATL